jgi:cytochrome c oxidase subunit IV
MSHSHTDHEAHNAEAISEIKKVTIILSVFTIIELILGFWMISMSSESLKLAVKGTIVILMMAKAFYIVAYFMHLKHEVKNLIMTIIVPLLLFVWFIGAFLWDGSSFRNLRNSYDPHFKEQATIKVEKKAEEHGAAKHEATDAKHEAADAKHETKETGHETAKPAVEPYY